MAFGATRNSSCCWRVKAGAALSADTTMLEKPLGAAAATPVYTPSPATASPPVPSSTRTKSAVTVPSGSVTLAVTVASVTGSPSAVTVAVIVTGSPTTYCSWSTAAARTTPVPGGSCTSVVTA